MDIKGAKLTHNGKDVSTSEKVTYSTTGGSGYYRIAKTQVNVGYNTGLFRLKFLNPFANYLCVAGINSDGWVGSNQANINMLDIASISGALGEFRIVYNQSSASTVAYLEILYLGSNNTDIEVELINGYGWELLNPDDYWVDGYGYIPSGYMAVTHSLANNDGVSSVKNISGAQLISKKATGSPPLTVVSTTMVPNLNADMVDGVHGTNLISKVTDTWHTLTLNAAFVSAGGSGTVKYRLNKIGQLELEVSLLTVGATPLVGNLPTGYRPTATKYLDQACSRDTANFQTFAVSASLTSSGNLSIADSNGVLKGYYNKFLVVSLD